MLENELRIEERKSEEPRSRRTGPLSKNLRSWVGEDVLVGDNPDTNYISPRWKKYLDKGLLIAITGSVAYATYQILKLLDK